ncbi:Uncharacterised protein [Bordetella trematum]|nr:Uncharacterised protein [Bordetella trematum]
MGCLALSPGEIGIAQGSEMRRQRLRLALLGQHGLSQGVDVDIHQGQREPLQAARLAQQMPIDQQLGPVQCALIVAHGLQTPAVGLDLFKLAGLRVVAIGAPAHRQRAMLARQRNLALVVGAAPFGHGCVPGHALLGTGRRREAQVQVAAAGRELAQAAHGHAQAHASSQAIWHTCTATPRARQCCSQPIWLSCSRSPGPLTSISS